LKEKGKEKEKVRELALAAVVAAVLAALNDDSLSEAERRLRAGISIIAEPLANAKLTRKCLKLVKKAAKAKSVRRGVKEVVKAMRKGEKGVMILAGNITPVDVLTHLPALCEEFQIPYCYVPSKEELGTAAAQKRPTSCVLVLCKDDTAEHAATFVKTKAAIAKVTPVYT